VRSVFFIPVFNEIAAFGKVLDELAATALPCDTILLVNNGSSDGSERLVRDSGHPYIDLPRNKGVGHANLLAVEWALENGYDVLGTMAANGKMLPSEMPRVLGPVLDGSADYVTGSRFLPGGASPNLPEFRRRAIPAVNHFVRLITGRKLTDATCGYRAWRLEIIRRARFDWHAPWLHTYGFEYYIYAKALMAPQFRCIEVPVTMRYPDRGRPYSKIRGARDWYAMLRPWVAARLDGKGFA
jgi:glycosyltransferase involved in cell wall biosynthesis